MSSSRSQDGRRRRPELQALSTERHDAAQPLVFTDAMHTNRYNRLQSKKFQDIRIIDWDVLETIGLVDDVWELISVVWWQGFFAIKELGFRELILEFLSTFYLNLRPSLIDHGKPTEGIITFRVAGTFHTLTLLQFTQYLGVYEEAFLFSAAYPELNFDLPNRDQAGDIWRHLSFDVNPYEAKRSKASKLDSPALHYIHHLLSHTLSGQWESSSVVS
ncbi:hypothetical protein KSP39_PZI016424 [Platanthera zijinensis]|uniref:Arabidopsis retrotransposon Orf1 C-terminal domain-containing protein n=1 Tax=Platanthera zijinensis TaxID=2320716 RepID=A0AAP0G063_9ASPA